jgi:hypothetical protein
MASDDPFRKVQEAGADFLETARAKAEEFLRELARATDTAKGPGTLEELLEASRKSTEAVVVSIRHEIADQIQLLGLATKHDLSNLESRLRGTEPAKKAPANKTAAKKAPAEKATPKKAAAKKTPANKTAAKKTAAKKTAAKKTPAKKAPTKKATG